MAQKILIITPFFTPAYSYGGIVKVAYDQAKGLIEKGFDVTVVTTDVYDAHQRTKLLYEDIDGIKIIRFKNISNYLAKFQNLYLPRGMRTWIKTNIKNYDIIHIHDIYNLPTYRGMKYALKYQKKYFIQSHGTLSQVSIDSRKKGIKNIILKQLRKYFDQANGFFALTEIEKKEIQIITNNTNILNLPNGLYVDHFKDIEPTDIHKLYNLDPKTKIITFLGRIQYIKGLDISLEILKNLDSKFQDWRFLIIGPDEGEKNSLVRLSQKLGISEKIIRYGEESSDKKYSLLKGSDLFLLLSRSEGFPMTVLESLICGVPTIVSQGTKMSILAQYNAGIVIDTSDINGVENQIIKILNNKDFYSKNGIDFVNQKYDIHHLIDTMIEYYMR